MIKLFQVFYKMAICISCLDIEMQKLLHPYPDRSALEILSDTAYMSAQIPVAILPWYFVKSTPRPAGPSWRYHCTAKYQLSAPPRRKCRKKNTNGGFGNKLQLIFKTK